MTVKLALLIKLLCATSICYIIEMQLHDTKTERILHSRSVQLSKNDM